MVCKSMNVDLSPCKTVRVGTLKRGDNFVFGDFGEKYPYVYIVTDVHEYGVEVVSISGKVFTFGVKVQVIPVQVTCDVANVEVQ